MLTLVRHAAVLAALLLFAQCAHAAEPLRWLLKPDQEVRFRLTQLAQTTIDTPGEPNVTNSQQTMDIVWRVESVGENGEMRVRQDMLRAQMKVTAPGEVEYTIDTDSDEPPMGLAALIAPLFQAVVEHDLAFTLSPQGKLLEIDAPEELLTAIEQVPGTAIAGSQDGLLRQMLRPALLPLSEEPLEAGQSWDVRLKVPMPLIGKQTVVTTYTYRGAKEVEGKSLEAIVPAMKIENEGPGAAPVTVEMNVVDSQGELLFDREAGRLVSADTSQEVALKIVTGEKETTGVVEQSTKLTPLEDAPLPGDPLPDDTEG